MSTGYGSRGFEVAYFQGTQRPYLSSLYRSVLGSGRSAAIVLNRFYVQQTDGTADGMTANDSVSGVSARLVWGLTAKIFNTKGHEKDVPYLSTTDAGFVQGYEDLDKAVFRGVEDGVGGAMASYVSGTYGMVLGTVTQCPGR
jgi:hypothetical protein